MESRIVFEIDQGSKYDTAGEHVVVWQLTIKYKGWTQWIMDKV